MISITHEGCFPDAFHISFGHSDNRGKLTWFTNHQQFLCFFPLQSCHFLSKKEAGKRYVRKETGLFFTRIHDSTKARDSSSPKSAIFSAMDNSSPAYLQPSSAFHSTSRDLPLEGDSSFYLTSREGNPFEETFADPLWKLHLKEASGFVKAFPLMDAKESSNGNKGFLEISAKRREGVSSGWSQRRLETPSTPGRPVFGFSASNLYRKSFPSKWDDAEKWLMSSSCHESPAHGTKPSETSKSASEQNEAKLPKTFHGVSSEVLLKDKFTDNTGPVLPNFRCSETSKEGFYFRDPFSAPEKDVHSRDVGTEMTPLCSLTPSRCHTPIKSSSPARHNTPADMSGPLVASSTRIDASELKDCHFAKLELSAQFDSLVSNWSSREEEEEEISKSLRHLEMNAGKQSIAESRPSLWEVEERAKSCIRYQREEAKIQAWVNFQTAKAEEKSRKLEVKIQKMRSNLEEKLMKRMAVVHRRAEEWRAEAQLQHSQQILRAAEHAQKMKSQQSSHFTDHRASCGCFPMQQ